VYIIDRLNNCNIYWNNTRLDIDFSASWANVKESCGENLHHLLGQLSWLSEEACSSRQVLALTNSLDVVSDQTTDRVLMLNRVKRALDEDGLRLYAQPIHNAKGEGYYEILSRLESDGEIIMPDQFIPVVAQFNLSQRFDMSVLEALGWISATAPSPKPTASAGLQWRRPRRLSLWWAVPWMKPSTSRARCAKSPSVKTRTSPFRCSPLWVSRRRSTLPKWQAAAFCR
jgi:hypothetical protein